MTQHLQPEGNLCTLHATLHLCQKDRSFYIPPKCPRQLLIKEKMED
jgi:hypothetical protein